jgi:hypothetical protein
MFYPQNIADKRFSLSNLSFEFSKNCLLVWGNDDADQCEAQGRMSQTACGFMGGRA